MKLRITLVVFCLLLATTLPAQVHLGKDINQIKALNPGKVFTTSKTSTGVTTYATDYDLGEFTYYMDNATGLCNFCMMTPKNAAALKAQIEIYNKKYTVVSPKKLWKTRMEDGTTLTINLVSADPRIAYFVYKNPS